MPFARILSLALAALALTGCEDVIVVDLDDGLPPRVVVEGGVVHSATVQTVRLTTTSDYFAGAEPPPVQGATVTISDDLGTRVSLVEATPGLYRTEALATSIGRTYTLDIEADGVRYRATETLREVAEIDSLYLIFQEGQGPDAEDGFRVRLDFRDPAGAGDGYRWQTFVDGDSRLPEQVRRIPTLISDDDLFDGQTVTGYSPNPEVAFQPGETVVVRQSSATPQALAFFDLLLQQAAGSPGAFDVPPADIRGNVGNLSDLSRPAYGYFWVRDEFEVTITVP
ncbi:MAG: DUF4249 domain-containing protein [Bacteroidota bacterium]